MQPEKRRAKSPPLLSFLRMKSTGCCEQVLILRAEKSVFMRCISSKGTRKNELHF
nr:hypothetical protein IL216_00003 [uncultured bacterium]QTC35093.1 hypothetical protein IL222_00001 [uncultured bacterium]